jgi:tetratricopeptide (TPR) repeat protein
MIFLPARALALYHQVKGGTILNEVTRTYLKNNLNNLACDEPPLANDSARARVQQAIAHLIIAEKYNPHLAQAHLLLGRAYCMMGEPENAVSAYKAYVLLRPENPLGHLEFGLAYALVGQKMSVSDWQTAGINPDQILAQADQAFNQKDYLIAARRYLQSAGIKELTFPAYLRWVIAAVISQQELPDTAYQILPVFNIAESGKTRIEAEYFRWLREVPQYHLVYGDRLIDHPGNDRSVARMWWAGDAIIIIQVPAPGEYEITIRAQNTIPPPIQMDLTINNEPVYPFEMERGDMSWQEYKTEVHLSTGFHIVGLRYLNNAVVDSVDRDAVIDWIEIEKK